MNAAESTAAALLPEHAAMVRKETIANTLASVVIAAGLSWLLFHGQGPMPALDEPPRGIFGIFPGTFNFTLLVTIALTLIVRRRTRLRRVSRRLLGSRLPANVLLRALLFAAVATLVMASTTGLLVRAAIGLGWLPPLWTLTGMTIFYVVYFALLSLLITPVVVRRALSD